MADERLLRVARELSHSVLDIYRRDKTSGWRVVCGTVLILGALTGLGFFFAGDPPSAELTVDDGLRFAAYIGGLAALPAGMWLLVSGLRDKYVKRLGRWLMTMRRCLAWLLTAVAAICSLTLILLLFLSTVDDVELPVYMAGGLLGLIGVLLAYAAVEINPPVLSTDHLESGSALRNFRRIAAGMAIFAWASIGMLWFIWAALLRFAGDEMLPLATIITLSLGLLGWAYSRHRSMERARREILAHISEVSVKLQAHPGESRQQIAMSLDTFNDVLVGDVLSGTSVASWNRAGNETRVITQYVKWRLSDASLIGLKGRDVPTDLKGHESLLSDLEKLTVSALLSQFELLLDRWAAALRPSVLTRSVMRKLASDV